MEALKRRQQQVEEQKKKTEVRDACFVPFCDFLTCEFLKFILHQTLVVYRDGCSFNGQIVRLRITFTGKGESNFICMCTLCQSLVFTRKLTVYHKLCT